MSLALYTFHSYNIWIIKVISKDTLLKLRCMYLCSAVSDSVNLSTIAHQLPLPMGFSGKNPGVGCDFLLQSLL